MADAYEVARRRMVSEMIDCLEELDYHDTARTLEKETGYFFNIAYFENCFTEGYLEEAEDYLSGFLPGIHDNMHSVNVYFELNLQKFMAALDDNKRTEAKMIVFEKLGPFERYHPDLIASAREIARLEDYRSMFEHEAFWRHDILGDERVERLRSVRDSLEANPLLIGKFRYPPLTPPTTPPLP